MKLFSLLSLLPKFRRIPLLDAEHGKTHHRSSNRRALNIYYSSRRHTQRLVLCDEALPPSATCFVGKHYTDGTSKPQKRKLVPFLIPKCFLLFAVRSHFPKQLDQFVSWTSSIKHIAPSTYGREEGEIWEKIKRLNNVLHFLLWSSPRYGSASPRETLNQCHMQHKSKRMNTISLALFLVSFMCSVLFFRVSTNFAAT